MGADKIKKTIPIKVQGSESLVDFLKNNIKVIEDEIKRLQFRNNSLIAAKINYKKLLVKIEK